MQRAQILKEVLIVIVKLVIQEMGPFVKVWFFFFFHQYINKFNTIDIDECLATNNGGCHTDAICTNTIGSFICNCKQNYAGTGFICNGNFFFEFLLSK